MELDVFRQFSVQTASPITPLPFGPATTNLYRVSDLWRHYILRGNYSFRCAYARPLSDRGRDPRDCTKLPFHCQIYMSHITYIFFLCNFWSAIFLLHMILRATIGRRCVCRFFYFLNYSPLCSPNTFFPFFLPFQRHGDNWIWDENFLSTFGSCLYLEALMIYWSFCLWTCTLILVLSGWVPLKHLVALFRPHFRSLFISLDSSLSLCCNIVFCFCFVILYSCMELSRVWWSSLDMRLNGMSESPFRFWSFHYRFK